MTSIRDLAAESLGVGERFCLAVEERDGRLLADHPYDASPLDVVVLEGLDRLDESPPTGPVEVEVIARVVDDRLVGRVVDAECSEPANREPTAGA
ncbi:hypothetical protein [Salinilacihabitans rarus]|uniref:hypothetical protein n=1 Tax=Salinilacihabitans rarus TaxID=2961596 RepID=UPI0020C8E230|nr:hypothetical protein [Salinilacihabitans rarus]